MGGRGREVLAERVRTCHPPGNGTGGRGGGSEARQHAIAAGCRATMRMIVGDAPSIATRGREASGAGAVRAAAVRLVDSAGRRSVCADGPLRP